MTIGQPHGRPGQSVINSLLRNVPLTPWTFVAILVGAVVSLLAYGPLARARGWRPQATLAALLLLTAALALTLIPDGGPVLGLAACLPTSLGDVRFDVVHGGGGFTGDVLNVLLFLPLAIAVVRATGRLWPALALTALPPLIELIQTMLPGRQCSLADATTNVCGILLGAAVGWLIERRSQRVRQ